MTATAATGDSLCTGRNRPPFWPQAVAPFSKPPQTAPCQSTAIIVWRRNLMQPCGKRTECARKKKRTCQDSAGFSSADLTAESILVIRTVITPRLGFYLRWQRLLWVCPFSSTEKENSAKRKDKRQQWEVCECGWCNTGPQAFAPTGSLEQFTKWLHQHWRNLVGPL